MKNNLFKSVLSTTVLFLGLILNVTTASADTIEYQWDFNTNTENWKTSGLTQNVSSGINYLDITAFAPSNVVWGWDDDFTVVYPTHSYKYVTFYVKGDWNSTDTTQPVTVKVWDGTQWFYMYTTITKNWSTKTVTLPYINEQTVVDKIEYVFPNTAGLSIDVDYVTLHWEPDNS